MIKQQSIVLFIIYLINKIHFQSSLTFVYMQKININYEMIMTLMRSEIDKFHKCLFQNNELSS